MSKMFVRPMDVSDHHFIVDSWTRSNRGQRDNSWLFSDEVYSRHYHIYLKSMLCRQEVEVRVAATVVDAEDEIVGWRAMKAGATVYQYIKQAFRPFRAEIERLFDANQEHPNQVPG